MGEIIEVKSGQLTAQRQQDRALHLVVDSLESEHSRRVYAAALRSFFAWLDGAPITKASVNAYKRHLQDLGRAPPTINLHLAAIRKLANEAADNDLVPYQVAEAVAKVKGAKMRGTRAGLWLQHDDAQRLLEAPDTTTLIGLRDRALLAVMLGAGLRRSEVAALTLDHVQQRDGRWAIVDLVGKGGRVRTVPIPSWTKVAIDRWAEASGIEEGRIFRPVNKGDNIAGGSMTPTAIWARVRLYAQRLDLNGLAPHDLRRTFAHLARAGRAPIDQISLSLGHASVQTTERYINAAQDFTDAPCDHLGLAPAL